MEHGPHGKAQAEREPVTAAEKRAISEPAARLVAIAEQATPAEVAQYLAALEHVRTLAVERHLTKGHAGLFELLNRVYGTADAALPVGLRP